MTDILGIMNLASSALLAHQKAINVTGNNIANDGAPGKFARLMNYAQGLADAYFSGGIVQADKFASLSEVKNVPVTGRAYSWMTDKDFYSPGGRFIRIPDNQSGTLGGNRFFTLQRQP